MGEGAYGKVYECIEIMIEKVYAAKIIEIEFMKYKTVDAMV